METVSESIAIDNTFEKFNSFNQRYTNKSVNFGDIMLLDQKSNKINIDSNLLNISKLLVG